MRRLAPFRFHSADATQFDKFQFLIQSEHTIEELLTILHTYVSIKVYIFINIIKILERKWDIVLYISSQLISWIFNPR